MKSYRFETVNGTPWMAHIVNKDQALMGVSSVQDGQADFAVFTSSDRAYVSFDRGDTFTFHVGTAAFKCSVKEHLDALMDLEESLCVLQGRPAPRPVRPNRDPLTTQEPTR